jgi:hypothetical protein
MDKRADLEAAGPCYREDLGEQEGVNRLEGEFSEIRGA